MATQHFKRNLLLSLYREEKTYRWFVSSCHLRKIKMSGTCNLFPLFGDPWPSCLLPSQYYLSISSSVALFSFCFTLSQHQVCLFIFLPNESAFHTRWPKYLSFSFSISPSNEYSGSICPGWMHETSARTWCSGKTWRERMEREVGGGIGMGKTCKLKAVSFQCMTKFTTN